MADIISLLQSLTPEKRAELEGKLLKEGKKFGVFPLSFAQQRLWFLNQFESDGAIYNLPSAIRIIGKLHMDALKKSIHEIIKRHEILRTIFTIVHTQPFQVILKDLSLDFPIIDISALPESEKEYKIREFADKEARIAFDLKKGPLLRIKILKAGEEDHVVLLTMHHIISDGWSMGIFTREIAALYDSFRRGKPSPLPVLKIQYADYSKWQNDFLRGKELDRQLTYWKERLGDVPPIIQLPYDKPRPLHQTFAGKHLSFRLSRKSSVQLKKIAHENEATLFMVLLAAFQTLLYRYSGQDDISVGTVIANRNFAETENLIGFFVNTLILRNDLSGDPDFLVLLRKVKEVTLGAYAHQDLPYEKLVEIIQPDRDLSSPPLFNVLFSLQNIPSKEIELSDIKIEALPIESDSVKFDLTLSMEERNDEISGSFGFNTDLFQQNTIERMIVHFKTLLEHIAADPKRPILSYPILQDKEKEQIVYQWNQTDITYPDTTIHHLFEEQVRKTPDKEAVHIPATDPTEGISAQITYAELNRRSNRLAHYLIKQGLKKEQVIGICLERSAEMIIAMLAILKAGASYLPIEPTYPEDRIRFMLEDTGAAFILTQRSLADRFTTYSGSVIVLDRESDQITTEDGSNPDLQIDPGSIAYIIYTSGSTGKPKGVLVEHRNLVNYILFARDLFALSAKDRVLQFASISFDAAGEEIYPTLISGATLVLRNDAMISSARTFFESAHRFGLTVLDLPTAYWHQLADEIHRNTLQLPANLRLIIIGGERAIPERVLWWQKKFGKRIRLLNTYGPTETTVVATYWELPPDTGPQPFSREVPIGKPIANARVYVLDRLLNPVPIGVPGELVIGGAGVARGYLNRPDLTKEKFLDNPFSKQGKMYRTGDLVRFLAEGQIEYLGRIDQQVKIRGFRIELGEIEALLRKHKAIRDAVLMAREDRPGDRKLVAYYVTRDKNPVPAAELRLFLKQELPDYMIPAIFMQIEEIPVSVTGKTNYRALPRPGSERPELEKKYVAPRNGLEKYLADLLQDVLKIDKIGVHDNFFEIGGDSLKAAIFINNLQQELKEILYVVILFDNQTIDELARYLSETYPETIEKKFGITVTRKSKTSSEENISHLSAKRIEEARTILSRKTDDLFAEKDFLDRIERKIPRAIFILSAPRSGSTLLRVMLAGNKKLFSPPELALLNFRTMLERKKQFEGRDSGWMEGLHRAVMEIKNCSFDEAKKIIASYERENFTTQEMYGELQQWIGDRIIVDKTTTYATDLNFLNRAETYFESPFYVQIVRHPAAMIQSYLDSNLDQVFGSKLPFPVREKAELFWLINNSNIETFFKQIPEQRRITIRYEDLVREPQQTMRSFCEKADIPFDPDMLEPYKGKKMRDGVHKESRMVGDPRFNQHKGIDPSIAEKWQTLPAKDSLYLDTFLLADKYHYDVHPSDRPVFPAYPVRFPSYLDLPLSFAQQRLWFLDQMEPGSPFYNIPSAVRMKGRLDIGALKNSLIKIMERHENLRASFYTQEGRARMRIAPIARLNLPVSDLRHLSDPNREEEIKRRVIEEARKPFHLDQGPLLRTSLLHVADDEYIFLLTMHHIISDGWSTSVFIREIVAFYNAFTQNRPIELPPLKIQYADFARWQIHWLSGNNLREQITFWKKQLEGAPPSLNLPTDRPRPAVQTFNGARIHFDLNKTLSDRIKAIAQEEKATLFMTLLAAYTILLYRYSGQDDILVGTPIANRNRKEIEPLIGFFVNTLVMRTDLSGRPSFNELINRVQKTVLEAFSHQDLPFEKLVDTLNIKRDVSRTPLFQTMFTLQNIPKAEINLADLKLEQIVPENPTAKFDLTLEMAELHDGHLGGVFEFNTDLFDHSTIERIIGHLKNILTIISENPQNTVDTIPLLSADERELILYGFNENNPLTYSKNALLHQIFERQAEQNPSHPALVLKGKELSFEELNKRANRLAHYLISKGVGPEKFVGILLDRSFDMITAILAVLKAGAAYLPLDPGYPEERLQYMLDDTQADTIITKQTFLKELGTLVPHIIDIEVQRSLISDEPANNPNINIKPTNPAYIIYTSGSTGRPKGVLIEHRSPLNLAVNLQKSIYEKYGKIKRRISLNAPISFDASVQQLVMLFQGHTLVLIPQEIRYDSKLLLNYIRQQRIEVLDCVPSQLKMLIREGLFDEDKWAPSDILPGGEAIDLALWDQLQKNKKVHFYNMYGPTECTVDSTICPVSDYPHQPVIGRPIPNVRFYVLDIHLNPVSIGVPGELHIAGDGLARGYLNHPELTAEKFIPDPFSKIRGARMYKTGDLVSYHPDGSLKFIGRVDFQVKLRGFRIELGEIETQLREHTNIKDAVVVVRSDDGQEERLIAYLLTDNQQTLPVNKLRSFLKGRLPEYMIPSVFVTLQSFPLLANGKINRKALPKPKIDRSGLETEYQKADTENEKILVKIWKEVLGLDKIGVHDNFFELGGDSILSIQVISRARQHGLQITPVDIFKHQTIAELAPVTSSAPVIEAEQGLVTGTIPLTPIQKYFFEKNLPVKDHWNQSLIFETTETFNEETLKETIRRLLAHHDALRHRFYMENGVWIQEAMNIPEELPFVSFDLSAQEAKKQIAFISEKAESLQKSLNLTQGALLRIAYFKRGTEQNDVILIIIHHLVTDGVSWRILLEDLQHIYRQLQQGLEVNLPPKTTAFKQWATQLTNYAENNQLLSEKEFWLSLAKKPIHKLPLDFPEGENTEDSAQAVSTFLDEDLTRALLQDVPAVYNTQINDILLSALIQAYAHWSGKRSLLIHLEGHGREPLFDNLDLSRTIGWFTALYPVYLALGNTHRPGDVIKSIKEQLRKIPNKGIGYGILRYLNKDISFKEQLSKLDEVSISFNYLGQFDQALPKESIFRPADISKGRERSAQNRRSSILDISASIMGNKLHLFFGFSLNQFKKQSIQAFADTYRQELNLLIKHCQNPEAGGHTASDFDLAKLDRKKLDKVMSQLKKGRKI